jgi:hypothetical protein
MIRRSKKVAPAALETTTVGVIDEAGVVTQVTEQALVEQAPVEQAPVEQAPAKVAKIRYAKREWAAGDVITVLAANTKKGKSFHRYALYTTGMTVAEYAQALKDAGLGGKTLANADLRWDVARKFISIAPKAE